MNMSTYLDEIRYALDSLVPPLWHERGEVSRLAKELETLAATTQDGYRRAEWLAMNPDLDDEGLGTLAHFETYFGPDKQQHRVREDLEDVRQRLEARTFAVGGLAGALLQLGKQAISLVHGGLGTCPAGRQIGAQDLSTVIWQARNQALHWEDGRLREPVLACFRQLEADFGGKFATPLATNLAFEVVETLGWHTSDDVDGDWALLS